MRKVVLSRFHLVVHHRRYHQHLRQHAYNKRQTVPHARRCCRARQSRWRQAKPLPQPRCRAGQCHGHHSMGTINGYHHRWKNLKMSWSRKGCHLRQHYYRSQSQRRHQRNSWTQTRCPFCVKGCPRPRYHHSCLYIHRMPLTHPRCCPRTCHRYHRQERTSCSHP